VNRWRGWHGGWWGPAVYHPPYRWGDYRRTGFYGSGFAGNRTVVVHNNINIYNYRRNVVTVNRINTRQRLIDNRVGNGENRLNSARRVNVYRDRQGNVYDRNRQGQWQPRDRRIQGGGNNNQNPSQNNVRNNNRVNRANRNNNVQPRPNNQQQPAQRPAQNTQRRRPDNNNRPNNNNSNNDNNNRPRRHHD
ncbi:MAG TPA: hypothetical protein VHB48_08315, partial [Chitinophagaceae bacterium]|nr:hypothetical protein [Chitinophagaceae bacterium]